MSSLHRILLLAFVAMTGCSAYVHGGYDTAWSVKGPLAGVVGQAAGAVPGARTSAAAAPAAPVAVGNSYSGGVGVGGRDFQVEVGVHVHDVTADSFSMPDATGAVAAESPRYLTASASLEARWAWARLSRFASFVHGGPVHALIVDRTSGLTTSGDGYRFGANLELALGPVTAYVDAYRETVGFGEGPAAGWSDLQGVTVGATFRH